MLVFCTILMMFMVCWAHHREGLFTAITMLVNIFLSGLITFELWEPIADYLEPMFRNTFVQGFEDFFVLIALFAGSLATLRWTTDNLAFSEFELPPNIFRFGGAAMGLVSGYLLAGFLLTALQTLPWHENFMSFMPRDKTEVEGNMRRFIPPDRAWRAMMRHAGATFLSFRETNREANNIYDRYRTFDRDGSFEIRYLRYRRYGEKDAKDRPPMTYQGEFDREINRK